jgi:hypothetical protein
MLENFPQILQSLPTITRTSSSSSLFGDATPFKVQVNFDISIFEGQIDADALEKILNLLEGYFMFTIFSIEKRSPLHSLRLSPMSNIGGKLTGRKVPQRSLEYLGLSPFGIFLWLQSRSKISLWETMMTGT